MLVVSYPIATHLLLPEVQSHRTQRVAMCKILCCKALYCYTLVVVAIGQAPLLPLKCFGCYMWFPSLYCHQVRLVARGGQLYCHALGMVVIGGTFYYHRNRLEAIGGALFCHQTRLVVRCDLLYCFVNVLVGKSSCLYYHHNSWLLHVELRIGMTLCDTKKVGLR
jgi:hypothetical protein